MPTLTLPRGRTDRSRLNSTCSRSPSPLVRLPGKRAGRADAGERRSKSERRTEPAEIGASRFCANVAPSIAEARIAWQTKRLERTRRAGQAATRRSREGGGVGARMGRQAGSLAQGGKRRPCRHLRQDAAGERGPFRSARWTIKWRRRSWASSSPARQAPFSTRWRRSGRASSHPSSPARAAEEKKS